MKKFYEWLDSTCRGYEPRTVGSVLGELWSVNAQTFTVTQTFSHPTPNQSHPYGRVGLNAAEGNLLTYMNGFMEAAGYFGDMDKRSVGRILKERVVQEVKDSTKGSKIMIVSPGAPRAARNGAQSKRGKGKKK